MTCKLVFMLATSVAFGTVTQVAHASCGGSACNSFSIEGRNYSSSEKQVKAVFINKAKSRGIRLKGCVVDAGKCSRTFVEPATTPGAILDERPSGNCTAI
jgi:hypothetical protein